MYTCPKPHGVSRPLLPFFLSWQISTLQIDDKRDFLISDDGGDAEVSAARERVSSRARW